MAVAPISRPLLPLTRWLIKWGAEAVALSLLSQLDEHELHASDMVWYRWTMSFSRATPAGTTEDAAVVTWDVVNMTSGKIDDTWVTADFNTVNNLLFAYWTSVKPLTSAQFTMSGIRAYLMRFADPMTPLKKFEDSGAPQFINTPGAQVGTAAGDPLPYQAAMSVTEKTAVRKHWGRFYWPGLTESSTDSFGRWNSSAITTMATACDTLYSALWNAQFPAVVVSTQHDKVIEGQLFNITNIQVDDVPDVVRRRRPKKPAIRTTAVVNP